MNSRETLLDFFHDTTRSSLEFLVYDDGFRTWSHSYSDVGRAAAGFAARLQRAGIAKGAKVVLWAENRPEWIACLWGVLLAGAVAVPVDYRVSPQLLERTLAAADARLLLVGREVPGIAPAGVDVWKMHEIDWDSNETPSTVEVNREDLAEILFTSGATSEPKGVMITHRNILANTTPVEREISKYRKYAWPFEPIRFLNLLPLSHLFGQSMAAFIPPMLQGTVVFMHGYSPSEIASQVRRRRISAIVCVPRILEVLREYTIQAVPQAADPPRYRHWLGRWWQYRRAHRLFGWKFWSFVVGAAPLNPDLEEFWSKLGFVVIQGYGLTETAPIVTLNHPFHTRRGSVGKPIAGVELKLAEDGEILVRGENVTKGYYNAPEGAGSFVNGWFRTGDVGSLDAEGRLTILGRKKEMIVTADGLNVFPEDVERVLNEFPGVLDSAVVGVGTPGGERVHAVFILNEGASLEQIISRANATLEDHQKLFGASIWPGRELPRTEGTKKLKRHEVREWVLSGRSEIPKPESRNALEDILGRYAGKRIDNNATLDDLGLSSLDRVELAATLEHQLGTAIPDIAMAGSSTVAELKQWTGPQRPAPPPESWSFPEWNRSAWAHWIRRINLPLWILPLGRVFSHVRARGLENLANIEPPVIFAANHQSHLDVPSILMALPAKWRYRVAPAMSKEFFEAHFYPSKHGRIKWFTSSLNYYLACLLFQSFPLPQREIGARRALRYAGELASEGGCVLIFPEGRISDTGRIAPFQPGVAMLASTLNVPVIPVRLVGLTRVLGRGWRFPRPGRVEIFFGQPIVPDDEGFTVLTAKLESAVRSLDQREY